MADEAAHWEKLEKLENSPMNKQNEFFAQYKDKFTSKPVSSVGSNIKVGDHIRFPGKRYDHHLICIAVEGNKVRVMEYTGPAWNLLALSQSTLSSDFGRLAGIQESVFPFSMLEEKNAEVIHWPKELERFPTDEVVKRAKVREGENWYDLTKNNCEHFVTWCKCGLMVSLQVKTWIVVVKESLCSIPPKFIAMVIANVSDEIIDGLKRSTIKFLGILPKVMKEFFEKVNVGFDSLKGSTLKFLEKFLDIFPKLMKEFFQKVNVGLLFGALVEAGIAYYDIEKAYDQWQDPNCNLIREEEDFRLKVLGILAKGFFRFVLGYLGSYYSEEITKVIVDSTIYKDYLGPCVSKMSEFLNDSISAVQSQLTHWFQVVFDYIGPYMTEMLTILKDCTRRVTVRSPLDGLLSLVIELLKPYLPAIFAAIKDYCYKVLVLPVLYNPLYYIASFLVTSSLNCINKVWSELFTKSFFCGAVGGFAGHFIGVGMELVVGKLGIFGWIKCRNASTTYAVPTGGILIVLFPEASLSGYDVDLSNMTYRRAYFGNGPLTSPLWDLKFVYLRISNFIFFRYDL